MNGSSSTTLDRFIAQLFSRTDMLRMGHGQRLSDQNLGLGWLYYGLGRILRPRRAVVIGSYRGFAPSVIARALLDNDEGGEVHFVDPSLADEFWSESEAVTSHFADLGTPNVHHHRYTTQAFVETAAYTYLGEVGMLMVDGLHTADQARFDFQAFLPKLSPEAVTLFHDSTTRRISTFYGEDQAYEHNVCDFMDRVREDRGLEIFTLAVASGVSLVRGRPADPDSLFAPFETKASPDDA